MHAPTISLFALRVANVLKSKFDSEIYEKLTYKHNSKGNTENEKNYCERHYDIFNFKGGQAHRI